MDSYTNNTVLDIAHDFTPSVEEHFGSAFPDHDLDKDRYLHHANPNTTYLLLPYYERVKVTSWLVEPLEVERVDVHGSAFVTSVRRLVLAHKRKDGRSELRGVVVEGSYIPSRHDNVSMLDSDRKFVNDFSSRPLKRLSVGDRVLVAPEYKKHIVMGESGDGLGVSVVLEPWGWSPVPFVVKFENVRVVQKFVNRHGDVISMLLLPDFRVVNTE